MKLLIASVGAAVLSAAIAAQKSVKPVEWPYYGGDQGGTKYSPADQVNRGNVARLALAWEWKTGERRLLEFGTQPGAFENTPLMIGDVVYLSTP